MNATRVPQPAPPTPPDRILLEMSDAEARVLYFISLRNLIIPAAIAKEYPGEFVPVRNFQDALSRALSCVGVSC